LADYLDLFLEGLTVRHAGSGAVAPDGPVAVSAGVAEIEVRGAGVQRIPVLTTDHGPVVVGGPGEPESFSLRTPSYALGELGFDCLLPLLRARTTVDVLSALVGWVEPVNNLLVADIHGDIRQQVVGRVPRRAEANRWRPVPAWEPEHAWTGWLAPLPGQAVPSAGHLVTANHRMNREFDEIGVDFAPPGRAHRIDALLRGRSRLTTDDCAEIHRDVLAGQPALLVEAIGRLTGLSPAGAELQREITGWDQRLDADSTTAAAYVSVRDAFVERLAHDAVLAPVSGGSPYGSLFEPWFALPTHLFLGLGGVLSDVGRALVPRVDEVLGEAVEAVAADRPGAWAERHVYRPLHPLGHQLEDPPGLAGDNDCVRCAGSLPGSDGVYRGSVARYVWDLAGLRSSGWVVPLGASGDPRDPHHHDQTAAWVAGTLLPVAT
jgi:penicillin amidase